MATGTSLLVCPLCCALASRSARWNDALRRATWAQDGSAVGQDNLYLVNGHVGYQGSHYWNIARMPDRLSVIERSKHWHDQRWRRETWPVDVPDVAFDQRSWRPWVWGIFNHVREAGHGNSHDAWVVDIPLLPVALLTAILPWRWRRQRLAPRLARRANRCSRCGYDLRATPERCPECGLVEAMA